jgi:hypothetical protein
LLGRQPEGNTVFLGYPYAETVIEKAFIEVESNRNKITAFIFMDGEE